MNYKELKNKFFDYLLLEKGYSVNTKESYEDDLDKFLEYTESNRIDLFEIENFHITIFVAELKKRNYSDNTILRILSSLRSFFKFLIERENFNKDISLLIELPKKPQRLPFFLTYEEIDKLINSIDTNKLLGLRDRALIELLYATGMRVSEALSLKRNDINFQEEIVRIKGKGEKERIVPLNKISLFYLNEYIEKERKKILKDKDSDFLFLNKNGKKLTRVGFWKILKKYSKIVGLNNLHPHIIRHTFATHLLLNGCDLKTLKVILGHSSISTTQIYTHVTKSHLHEVIEKYHPRGKGEYR
ncbi:MAG: site-specific tyrosine recombinase XerD [Candidatus Hydrothermales bacterium]